MEKVVFATKSYVDNKGNIIAELKNVNLKTVAETVIPFLDGYDSSNTMPERLVIKMSADDVYDGSGLPETPATTTIVFDNTKFPSNLGLIYSIRIFVGATEIFNGNEPAGFASNADWMDYVKGKFEGAGYTVVIDGLNMQLTGASGLGATINGSVVEASSRDENAGVFTDSLSSSPAFANGISAAVSAFDIKLDDIILYPKQTGLLLADFIELLLFEENILNVPLIANNDMYVYRSVGQYIIDVSIGTVTDFHVDIYIYGEKI